MDTNTVISVCSVVIALAALGTAVWQGYLNRKHNKLSVMPKLNVLFQRGPDSPIKFILKNRGLGPAEIVEFKLLREGAEYSLSDNDSWHTFFKTLGYENLNFQWTSTIPMPGSTLLPGESIEVLVIMDTHEGNNSNYSLIEKFEVISFSLKYRSMYEDMISTKIGFIKE